MNKEFNLSEKRKQMFLRLQNTEPDVDWIIQVIEKEIEKQDKEFIRLLKEEILEWDNQANQEIKIIDKLAGKELI
jgi:hypothetical protein